MRPALLHPVARWWLLLLALLGAGCAHGQAPVTVYYSGPLVITQGGTYSGNYRSSDSNTPAIRINTTQPVVLQNCILVGPGTLIDATHSGCDLTVRECQGYGLLPTANDVQRGFFLNIYKGKNLVVEHNYLESNRGIVCDHWAGNGSAGQTLLVRYNRARNIIGNTRNNPQSGLANFLLLNTVVGLAGLEVSWNEVENRPGESKVEDVFNFYNAGGTAASPARLHDNFVLGAYPLPATSTTFNGSGFTTDGDSLFSGTTAGYIEVAHNQFVSLCNAGINLAAGHDIYVHDNRVVSSGYTSDSSHTQLGKVYCGMSIFNFYNQPAATFGNFTVQNNAVGYVSFGHNSPYPDRYDYNLALATTQAGNVSLPPPITTQTEQDERTLWQQKLQLNGIVPGPTAAAGAAAFYRAFNLNGPATTIDSNAWEAGAALQASGGSFVNQSIALSPVTDTARSEMIRASIYGPSPSLTLPSLPAGSYRVFLYTWADNAATTYSVLVNGQVVQSSYNSGFTGHWAKLGPFAVAGTGGPLVVGTSGGTANCSGLEIWQAVATTGGGTTPMPLAARAASGAAASLYPNPLGAGQGQVQVAASLAQAQPVLVHVLDPLGRVVCQATLAFPAGASSQPLPVADLAAGLYLVRFVSGPLLGTTLPLVRQ